MQYPRQQLLPRQAVPPLFKIAMPWEARGLLMLFGLVAIFLAGCVLFFVGVFFWAIITA